MGGAVSAGRNNQELIDNLCDANLIKHQKIEKAFRLVDRAYFFPVPFQENAYKDIAWKHCFYHISAPCIYAEVLNALEFEEGISFLNIGSGTGYLSTLAGIIIGDNGINDGIEISLQLVEFAEKNVEKFCANVLTNCESQDENLHDNEMDKYRPINYVNNGVSTFFSTYTLHQNILHSKASDITINDTNNISVSQNCYHSNREKLPYFLPLKQKIVSFCKPKFINYDLVDLISLLDNTQASTTSDSHYRYDSRPNLTYDRVYCGASCPPGSYWEGRLKHLINIGGILVLPLKDQLVKIKRVGPDLWSTEVLVTASFAPLLLPETADDVVAMETSDGVSMDSDLDSLPTRPHSSRHGRSTCAPKNACIPFPPEWIFKVRSPPNLVEVCRRHIRRYLWEVWTADRSDKYPGGGSTDSSVAMSSPRLSPHQGDDKRHVPSHVSAPTADGASDRGFDLACYHHNSRLMYRAIARLPIPFFLRQKICTPF